MDANPTTWPQGSDASRKSAGAEGGAPRGRRGCVTVALGSLLVVVGIPMLICPGPGVAVIAAGFGMIAVGLGLRSPKEP
ncbi:MAG: hypothetical protein U1E29_01005 [Coriobacteriia bacterium]|nr:hypothetical protein [Coriobacteriia bacterium]